MNEENLHLAQAMVGMTMDEHPRSPKKTVVGRVQEKVQGFRQVKFLSRTDVKAKKYKIHKETEYSKMRWAKDENTYKPKKKKKKKKKRK